jgi:hypothetical protein
MAPKAGTQQPVKPDPGALTEEQLRQLANDTTHSFSGTAPPRQLKTWKFFELEWTNIARLRPVPDPYGLAANPHLWWQMVESTLHGLFEMAPNKSSQAVLNALMASKKTVVIEPANVGMYTFNVGGKPRTFLETDAKALCSNTLRVWFTTQDFLGPQTSGAFADEELLHEIFHSLRCASGIQDKWTNDKLKAALYDDQEEFYAILVANIYRSEMKRQGVRANHHSYSTLSGVRRTRENDSVVFYDAWRPLIDKLIGEMRPLCQALAKVQCAYNPIAIALPYCR